MEINGNGTKLIWWLMAIFSTVIVAGVGALIVSNSKAHEKIGVLERDVAVLAKTVVGLEEFQRMVRQEQMDRATRLSNIDNRLNLMDAKIDTKTTALDYRITEQDKVSNERLATMTKRILDNSRRVDDAIIGKKGSYEREQP